MIASMTVGTSSSRATAAVWWRVIAAKARPDIENNTV